MTVEEEAEIQFYKDRYPCNCTDKTQCKCKYKQLERIYDSKKRQQVAKDAFSSFFGQLSPNILLPSKRFEILAKLSKDDMDKAKANAQDVQDETKNLDDLDPADREAAQAWLSPQTFTGRLDAESSPAEFILDAINPDFVKAETDEQAMSDNIIIRKGQVEKLLDSWNDSGKDWKDKLLLLHHAEEGTMEGDAEKLDNLTKQDRPGFGTQYLTNLDMIKKDMWRNPISIGVKFFGNFVFILYLALIALNTVDYNQKDLENRMKNLNTMTQFAAAAAPVITVIKGFADNKIVESQVRNGMNCQSYTFALLTLEIPCFCVTAILPLFFCGFVLSEWEWTGFFPMALGALIYQTCLEGQAHISGLRRSFALGLIEYVNFWLSNFFFCGLAWGRPDVNWPWKLGFYVHPGYWMNQATTWSFLRWAVYEDATIEGCETANVTGCSYNYFDGEAYLPGWSCPNTTTGDACWGATGIQVLDSLHKAYDFVDSEDDNYGLDIGMLCGFTCLYLIGYNITFKERCTLNSEFEDRNESDKALE